MQFYYDLIDSMQNSEFKPGWEKEVYPAKQFIHESITKNELYLAYIDNTLVSAMVINHDCAEGYNKAKWKIAADKKKVFVIHALGISLLYQGQGIAKQMVAHAIDLGKEKGMEAIRLDVLASNRPAQKLYSSTGFVYIDTIQLFYEDTGLTDFLLYELVL